MKKILLLFSFAVMLLAVTNEKAKAQTSLSFTATNPTGAVLNATVDTLNLTMSGAYSAVMTVQCLLTKTSGTVAGTVRLYGSNYNNVTGTWAAVGDTLTLSNAATNSHVWSITQPCYKYYQILQSGGTTVAGLLTCKALAIKPN